MLSTFFKCFSAVFLSFENSSSIYHFCNWDFCFLDVRFFEWSVYSRYQPSVKCCISQCSLTKPNWQYEYILIQNNIENECAWDLLEWLTGCGPTTTTVAFSQCKDQEPRSCSVYKAGYHYSSPEHTRIQKKKALIPATEWTCQGELK